MEWEKNCKMQSVQLQDFPIPLCKYLWRLELPCSCPSPEGWGCSLPQCRSQLGRPSRPSACTDSSSGNLQPRTASAGSPCRQDSDKQEGWRIHSLTICSVGLIVPNNNNNTSFCEHVNLFHTRKCIINFLTSRRMKLFFVFLLNNRNKKTGKQNKHYET